MFPKKVYHCPCVAFEIKLCLINSDYLLKDIISNLNKNVNDKRKIYCSKCRNDECIFSCRQHMQLTTICENDGKRCLKCINIYLKASYYHYDSTNFDLPIAIKKEKKVLRLLVEKL